MKRFLLPLFVIPLLVIPPLILAGSAVADDEDDALDARIAEVEAKIMEVSGKARSARDEAALKAIATEIQTLQTEMADLQEQKEARRLRRVQAEQKAKALEDRYAAVSQDLADTEKMRTEAKDPDHRHALDEQIRVLRKLRRDLEVELRARGGDRPDVEAPSPAEARRLTHAARLALAEATAKQALWKARYDNLQAKRRRSIAMYEDDRAVHGIDSDLEHVSEEIALLEKARRLLRQAQERAGAQKLEDARAALEEALELARGIPGPPAPPTPRIPVPPAPPRTPSDRPFEAGSPGTRIDHLRAAARHLRQAGAEKQAAAIEREIRILEKAEAGPAQVEAAVRALTEEVRDLRRQVHELKEILLEGDER